jgi:hypothetical protein
LRFFSIGGLSIKKRLYRSNEYHVVAAISMPISVKGNIFIYQYNHNVNLILKKPTQHVCNILPLYHIIKYHIVAILYTLFWREEAIWKNELECFEKKDKKGQ